MSSPKPAVAVLGRTRSDLFTFKYGKNNYLQGLQAGPELLHKFLSDLKQPCYLQNIIGPEDIQNTDIPFSMIELSAIAEKYEVSRQQPREPLFTVNVGPISITRGPGAALRRCSKEKKKAANVLVFEDTDGALFEPNSNQVLEQASIVFYQTRRPEKLLESQNSTLAKILNNEGLQKFVVILDAADLRANDILISQNSWEKAAADTVKNFNPNQYILSKQEKIKWIIRFSHVGAVVLQTDVNPPAQRNTLYFDSSKGEGEFIETYSLHQTALEAAFLSGLVSAMSQNVDNDQDAIQTGLSCTRQLSKEGIVPVPDSHSIKYPILKSDPDLSFQRSIIPPSSQLGQWTILSQFCDQVESGDDIFQKMINLGKKIVKDGIAESLPAVPIAKFGKITTADRSDIEEFHRISNVVETYLRDAEKYYIISKEGKEDINRALIQPLSIAVFGEPGSGKSYTVKQIIGEVQERMTTPKELIKYPLLEYNLSQFIDYSNLLFAFQEVRDKTVSGQIPIVIFDEFDTTLNGELGWLKFFLGPMQDGKFFDQGKIRPIGHAVFIFIGGTRSTYARFQTDKIQLVNAGTIDSSVTENPTSLNATQGPLRRRSSIPGNLEATSDRAERAVKKPDFVSRLQDHLDIRGYNKPSSNDPKYIIRRAILIHFKIDQIAEKEEEKIELDDSVLQHLLTANTYRHGARSIDNIFKGYKIVGSKLCVNIHSSELDPPYRGSRQDEDIGQGSRHDRTSPDPSSGQLAPDQGNLQGEIPPDQGNLQYVFPPVPGNLQYVFPPGQGNIQYVFPPGQGNLQYVFPTGQGNLRNGISPGQLPSQLPSQERLPSSHDTH